MQVDPFFRFVFAGKVFWGDARADQLKITFFLTLRRQSVRPDLRFAGSGHFPCDRADRICDWSKIRYDAGSAERICRILQKQSDRSSDSDQRNVCVKGAVQK